MSVKMFFKNLIVTLINLFFRIFGITLFQIINRKEIWLRMLYYQSAESKELTRIWRPYNRTGGEKSFKAGDVVDLRFIKMPGNDQYGIPPVFKPISIKVKIRFACCVQISKLKRSDFLGSGPFIHDQKSLLHELSIIYDLKPEKIETATFFDLEYL